MTPLELTLEGFTGIRHGLGRESVTIDLAEYEGLVAITGENGKGKTTILDNLQPYRLMPSKVDASKSGYSPAAFSYYDHTGNKARKMLLWSHGGLEYKTEIVIKASASGKTKSTESYLFFKEFVGGDERIRWSPYKLGDGTESDGKNEVYDRCVADVLGSPDAFFTSAFASQGRAPLCEYRNADIKDLLSEMLNLGRIRDLGERAAQVRAQLKSALTPLQEMADRAKVVDSDIASYKTELAQLEGHLTERKKIADDWRLKVKDAELELAEEKRRRESIEPAMNERREIEEQILAVEKKGRAAGEEAEKELKAETTSRAKDIEALHNKRKGAAAHYQELDAKKKQAKALLSREEQIREQAASHEAASKRLDAVEKEHGEAFDKKEAMTHAKSALQEIEGNFAKAKQEGSHKASSLEDLKARAGLVDNVPCVGTPMNLECQLLENANNAKHQVASIEVELEGIRKRCMELKTERENFIKHNDLGEYAAIQERAAELSREREKLRLDVAASAEAKTKLADLEARKEGYADLEQAIKKAADDVAELEAQMEAREKRHQEAEAKIAAALAEKRKEYTEQFDALSKKRGAIEIPNVDIQAKQGALDSAALELAKHEKTRDGYIQDIANCKAAIDTANQYREKLEDSAKKHGALSAELSVWEQLTKALGNDGIIALSIDDAGPTISSICNDLLRECYGPRFTVGIQTQVETAKGTAKETFDIRVFDAQADEEKSIRMTSGGEGLWLNEALTRSIALFQAQQSGQAYETLFADESDGALDIHKKVEFIRMKRAVLDLGGYQREYFITHTPELWDLADHIIDVGEL